MTASEQHISLSPSPKLVPTSDGTASPARCAALFRGNIGSKLGKIHVGDAFPSGQGNLAIYLRGCRVQT